VIIPYRTLSFISLQAEGDTLPSNGWHNVRQVNIVNIQIGDWLGLPPPSTDSDMLRIVEGRLTTAVIKRLISLGLQRPEIDATIIPLRTLQHRRARRERLTVDESDRVLRVIRVLSLAESVYGSRGRALAWLRRPNPRIDNRTPLELLETSTGNRIVEEMLVQIDEGMFV
jgi:putative toxin-antitoxin system antitoxin component (TIGR02293 family)